MSAIDHIRLFGVLTELQSADVRCDGPPVDWRELRGVVGHRSVTVADHIEEVPQGGIPQPGRMMVACGPIAALHNHSATVAHTRVAGGAVDVVTLLTAFEHRQ